MTLTETISSILYLLYFNAMAADNLGQSEIYRRALTEAEQKGLLVQKNGRYQLTLKGSKFVESGKKYEDF
jgi:predicted transcriptional regulator